MKTSNELYQWLPADERLAHLLKAGSPVIIKFKNEVTGWQLPKNNLWVEQTIEEILLEQRDTEYLPPNIPEVLESPDSEGWWWTWSKLSGHGPRWLCFEYPNPKLSSKGYFVNASLYPKPNFNPVTGEKL